MQYLKDSVRKNIYSAAIEEFKTFGYQDASIRNIATNAGISLGNIYRYYKNKEDLYIAVIQPLVDSVKEFVENKYFVEGDSMQTVAENILDFLVEHDDEIIILRRGNTKYYKQFSEYLDNVTAEKIEYIMRDSLEQSKIKNSTKDKETRKVYVHEIITFYFGNLETRFGK